MLPGVEDTMNAQTQSETKQMNTNKQIEGTNFEPAGNIFWMVG
jgi:hypothetical protein